MFIRPELRKGDFDLRLKAPKELVEALDLIAVAIGVSRQDVIVIALSQYVDEQVHVSRVLARGMRNQRSLNGTRGAADVDGLSD